MQTGDICKNCKGSFLLEHPVCTTVLQISHQWIFLNDDDIKRSWKPMLNEKCCTKADQPTSNYSKVRLFWNNLFWNLITPTTSTFEWLVICDSRLSWRRTRKCRSRMTRQITACWSEQLLTQQSLTSENSSHCESIQVNSSI